MSSLDVDRVMHEIRAEVARRQIGSSADTTRISHENAPARDASALSFASDDFYEPLRLQPVFSANRDRQYHVNDLLKYHGRDFVKNAYLALLGRGPDESGLIGHLDNLASGNVSKIDVLWSLHRSDEGKTFGATVSGLALPATVRRIERLPVIGALIETVVAVLRLPAMVHNHRQTEFYNWAQRNMIVERINALQEKISRHTNVLSTQLDQLRDESRTHSQKLQQIGEESLAQSQSLQQTRGAVMDAQNTLNRLWEDESAANDETHQLDALYTSLEDEFRGHPDDIKSRLKVYLPYLTGAGISEGVVDIGSGRGEWLQVLREAGISATGVDRNQGLTGRCRAAGLDVIEDDAIEYLRARPGLSLNAISSFHLIEHLRFDKLVKLLDEALRVLRPGGLLILETPNPENFIVSSYGFYVDPTHRNPIPPPTLKFLLEFRGFGDVEVLRPRPRDAALLQGDDDVIRMYNEHFCSSPDYGVVARKPAGAAS